MYEKLLFTLVDLLRGVAAFDDSVLFSLQLLAWIRLSGLQAIPTYLQYEAQQPLRTVQEVDLIFQALASARVLENNAPAFDYVPESIRYVESEVLSQLFQAIDKESLIYPCSVVQLVDYVASLQGVRQPGGGGIAQELADLLVGLAAIADDQAVYLPFETDLQLTYRTRQYTQQVFPVSQHHTLLPWLFNILGDLDVRLATGNELASPHFVQNGCLQQFPVTVALPPFGMRVKEDFGRQDAYRRFPEFTSSFSVLVVRHICATTFGRAVIGIPNGVLFSPGTEQALRAFLLESQVVEGVIALPPALVPDSPVPFSLLLLNTTEPQAEVFFVDGTKPAFSERDGKGRSVLSGWETLRDLYFARQPGPCACLVPAREVLRNGTNLLPARYCLEAEVSATQQLLATYPTAFLGEVVEFVRPAALASKEGELALAEVGVSDFPEFGYLPRAGRAVRTTEPLLVQAAQRKLLLRGHDILIAMKGAVGKVALVDPQLTTTWTASLACLLLRVDPARLDARVLFVFLQSAAGQSLLRQLVSAGATVALIQLRDLKKLLVPIPPAAEQQLIIKDFEHIAAIEQEISLLREQQLAVAANVWVRHRRS